MSTRLCLTFLVIFVAVLTVRSAHVALPSHNAASLWYTTALKQTLQQAISNAQESVYVSAFALHDESLISLLEKKGKQGLQVEVLFDIKQKKPPHIKQARLEGKKCRGHFHRKILIIDERDVYFGSANFTHSSLTEQANHIAGFRSPPLARFLKEGVGVFCDEQVAVYMLPSKEGLESLLFEIEQATKSISLALFSLTHPRLLTALSEASKRGVNVRVIVDRSSLRWVKDLDFIFVWQEAPLMHHKLAIFDGKKIAFGSANWTKGAFEKNSDLIAFMPAPKEALALFEQLMHKSLAQVEDLR